MASEEWPDDKAFARSSQAGTATLMAMSTLTSPAPDLLGIRLAHRAMIADLDRLAEVTRSITAGESDCPPRRARAITEYLLLLCDSIHHHHTVEDDVLWPLLASLPDASVDLAGLEDDHAQLDPALDRLRATCAEFTRSAAGSAAALAEQLGQLRDSLAEHIADEESAVFPVIEGHLTGEQWAQVEAAAQKGSKMSFELPRMAAECTPEEWLHITETGGVMLKILLAVFKSRHRRRERVIAGR